MKIRHLPCQPSALSVDPCHNNMDQKSRKEAGRKASDVKASGGETHIRRGDIMLLEAW